jgi:GTP-binding protein
MLPIIAIIGRPNVGKSTLFNRFTRTRDAIIVDYPGVTRDRQYGIGHFDDQEFIVIDTGGLQTPNDEMEKLMILQTEQAIDEAEAVLFVVDARAGLTPEDRDIAKKLRVGSKKVYLVANKTDGLDIDAVTLDFYELGLGTPIPISASNGRGIADLLSQVFAELPTNKIENVAADFSLRIKIAFVGKPNVGKSTLINNILGEKRVIAFDQPGTTRDSIYIKFSRRNKDYVLIDTAGVRKTAKIHTAIEKFSIVKTMQAINEADVVVLLLDASSDVTDQDLHILGHCLEEYKPLVIAINKWDAASDYQREQVKEHLDQRLAFIDFARIHFISALHGTAVGKIFYSINEAYNSAQIRASTSALNKILQAAVQKMQPPMSKGRRIKLRYAHMGGNNPPLIVVHGTQTQYLPDSYRKYLSREFRHSLNILGTPLRLAFKNSENPYV